MTDAQYKTPASGRPVLPGPTHADGPAAAVQAAAAAEVDASVREFRRLRLRDNRRIWWFVAVLLLVTGYFAALNWLQIRLTRHRGVAPLELVCASTENQPVECRVELVWGNGGEASRGARPEVMVGGKRTPGVLVLAPTSGHGQKFPLTIEIPWDCAPGSHQGTLKCTPLGAGLAAGAEPFQYGLDITVPKWHQRWWVLRDWLFFAASVYAFLWLACMLLFASPGGFLLLRDWTENCDRPSLSLKPRFWSLLFPWTRDALPLSWVWRKASLEFPPFSEYAGRLLFDKGCPPTLELEGDGSAIRPVRVLHRPVRRRPLPEDGTPRSFYVMLGEDATVILWDTACKRAGIMRYKKDDLLTVAEDPDTRRSKNG